MEKTDSRLPLDILHRYWGYDSFRLRQEDVVRAAMEAGADMAAVSMHKSGGSLTQSSLLLLGKSMNMRYVEQIINMQEVIEVPGYPPYAKGIVNLRGSIVPILDLRMRLGRTEGMYTQRTCIVIMSINDQQMGYIVDEVDAVVVVSNKQIEPPPHMRDVSEDKRYLTGIAKLPGENGVGEKIVLCLEPTKIELEERYKGSANQAV